MKTNKTGQKFIVFLVLISLVLLFVTCEEMGEGTTDSQTPSNPSEPLPDNSYRVIYDKNAIDATGTMANSTFTVGGSGKLSINSFVRNNYCFLGWAKTKTSTTEEYTDGQSIDNLTTAGKTITLYAVWHEAYTVEVTAGSTLAEKFTWINNNVESYTTYIIEINSDIYFGGESLSYGAKKHVTIHLKGTGSIISSIYSSSSSSSSIFSIPNGVTMILDGNLTLSGNSRNPYAFSVEGGNLIMNGGKISGNTVDGIYMKNGTFTMNNGEISGNSGGVYVERGTFTMNGGEISGNTYDGGVYVKSGTFTMNGGEIGNNAGGGVLVWGGGALFIMNDGKISGNAAVGGGGVYVKSGTFTMNGGEISGNTAVEGGGGVHVTGTFNKTGGTITGSNSTNSNVIEDWSGNIVNNKGRAVYASDINNTFEKRKETTAGPGDNLSFTYDKDGKPIWSGAWDY